MTAPDWHARAAQADPLEPATEPTLALILPMPGTTIPGAPAAAAPAAPDLPDLPDSADTALGARTAAELVTLTRVLLGLGAPAAPAAAPAVAPAPAPVVPEPLVPAFVAPPVVEVAPLVPVADPAPEADPEPAAHAPEPEPARRNLLDELSFLDT